MLLVMDIGNTNITLGCYADGALLGIGRRDQGLIRFDVGLTGGN